jgi:hypothetical protein
MYKYIYIYIYIYIYMAYHSMDVVAYPPIIGISTYIHMYMNIFIYIYIYICIYIYIYIYRYIHAYKSLYMLMLILMYTLIYIPIGGGWLYTWGSGYYGQLAHGTKVLVIYFFIIIDVFLYLCLFGWSVWEHMVHLF